MSHHPHTALSLLPVWLLEGMPAMPGAAQSPVHVAGTGKCLGTWGVGSATMESGARLSHRAPSRTWHPGTQHPSPARSLGTSRAPGPGMELAQPHGCSSPPHPRAGLAAASSQSHRR